MIKTILKNKGDAVITIGVFESVRAAMDSMIEHKIAALVLTNGAEVVGVATERDILRAISNRGPAILNAPSVISSLDRSLPCRPKKRQSVSCT